MSKKFSHMTKQLVFYLFCQTFKNCLVKRSKRGVYVLVMGVHFFVHILCCKLDSLHSCFWFFNLKAFSNLYLCKAKRKACSNLCCAAVFQVMTTLLRIKLWLLWRKRKVRQILQRLGEKKVILQLAGPQNGLAKSRRHQKIPSGIVTFVFLFTYLCFFEFHFKILVKTYVIFGTYLNT